MEGEVAEAQWLSMYSAQCQVGAMAALLLHSAECLGEEDDATKRQVDPRCQARGMEHAPMET